MSRALCVVSMAVLLFLPGFIPGDETGPPALAPEERTRLEAEAEKLFAEGFKQYQAGKTVEALKLLEAELRLRRRLHGKEPHPALANSLNAVGVLLHATGQSEQAVSCFLQSLEMQQKLFPQSRYPDGHRELAASRLNLGSVLETMGRSEQALPHFEAALGMYRRLYPKEKYPDGHPELALGLNNLASVLGSMGQSERALTCHEESLAMLRRLYPESRYPAGHPYLAASLNNLGGLLESMGQPEKALPYRESALAMRRRLYPESDFPDGHPDVAGSLKCLASTLQALGQPERALTHYESALAMFRRLYPESRYPAGNRELANSIDNLGVLLQAMGRSEQALRHFEAALAMYRRFYTTSRYPDGHSALARSQNNLGATLLATGRLEQALPYFRDSLAMQQRLLRRELATASEEAAFDRIAVQPLYRDAYLNITRLTKTPADEVFARLWPTRSVVTRLLEQRQAQARAAGTALGEQVDRLHGLRRQMDRLLQDSRMNPEARDRLLASVAGERDRLEREVVARMPTLKHWQELDTLGPGDLGKALPAGAVFVDVIRYNRFEFVNNKERRIPAHVVFVVARGGSVRRIELDEAAPVDAAVAAWREQIEAGDDDSRTSAELGRRVWAKLAPAIPPDTTMIYLAPDGELARLPWAALPIGENRVLLERFALAQVPHGTFLLDHLRGLPNKTPGTADGAMVALGGLDYGASRWLPLPATTTEVAALRSIAPGPLFVLSGRDATSSRLAELLPTARTVHFATHGEFKADELTTERRRALAALESRQVDGSRAVAAKNPLGYVGLVLSDGEVLSGLKIVDLPLGNLKLACLSACETGLGALTGGEGVQGLQRAFHLAGCPNVVASLWKVNDDATAALMTKFYHELLVNQKSPIEALREAQLLIYRQPDLVKDLLAARGTPRKKTAVATDAQAVVGTKHAATKLWAAFVLSGVGR